MEDKFTKLAQTLARTYHKGQYDKGGKPYIGHIETVVSNLGSGASEEAKQVAWLHDTIEDTNLTFNDLKIFGFSSRVISAIDTMTKRSHDPADYKAYLDKVKANPLSRQVKIADLKHNSDISRLQNPSPVDLERMKKYKFTMKYLKS